MLTETQEFPTKNNAKKMGLLQSDESARDLYVDVSVRFRTCEAGGSTLLNVFWCMIGLTVEYL